MCRFLGGHTLSIPLSKYQKVQFLDCMVRVILGKTNKQKPCPTVFQSGCTTLHSHCNVGESPLGTSSPSFGVISFLDFGYSNWHVVVSCCLILLFPAGIWWGAPFYMFICHLYTFFDEVSVKIFVPFGISVLNKHKRRFWYSRSLAQSLRNNAIATTERAGGMN